MTPITPNQLAVLPTGPIDAVVQHLSQNEAAWGFGINRHRLAAIEATAAIEVCPSAIIDAIEERVTHKKDVGLIEDIEPLAVRVANHYHLTRSHSLPGVSGTGLAVTLLYQGSLTEHDALRILNFPLLQIDTWQNKHLTKVNLIIVPERLGGGKR